MKRLEEKLMMMTLDLDMSPEVQATKEKMHKLVFIKIQNVFFASR